MFDLSDFQYDSHWGVSVPLPCPITSPCQESIRNSSHRHVLARFPSRSPWLPSGAAL